MEFTAVVFFPTTGHFVRFVLPDFCPRLIFRERFPLIVCFSSPSPFAVSYSPLLLSINGAMNGINNVKDYDTKVQAIFEQCRISQKLLNYVENFNYPYVSDVTYYEQLLKIGQGTFGEVFKARCKRTGRLVALKKILMENEKEGFPITALREIKMLQRLRHLHITELVEVCTSRQRSGKEKFCFYLVFTFCEHDLAGLLSNVQVKIRLVDIKTMMQHILRGLHKIHNSQILHRDMKAANVLITGDGVLKLADFGLARLMYKQPEYCYTNRVVTLWYRPPELLLGTRHYGPAIDIWGAGCILAELWIRAPILQGNTEQSQLELISKLCGSINPHSWPGCDKLPYYNNLQGSLQQNLPRRVRERINPFLQNNEQALSLIDLMLTLNPEKRPTASAALDHNFFFEAPMPANNIQELLQQLKGTNLFEYTSGCGAHANRRRPVAPAAPMHQQQQMRGKVSAVGGTMHRTTGGGQQRTQHHLGGPLNVERQQQQQHVNQAAEQPAVLRRPQSSSAGGGGGAPSSSWVHQQQPTTSSQHFVAPSLHESPMKTGTHQQQRSGEQQRKVLNIQQQQHQNIPVAEHHHKTGNALVRMTPPPPPLLMRPSTPNSAPFRHGQPQQYTAQRQPIRPQRSSQNQRQPHPKFFNRTCLGNSHTPHRHKIELNIRQHPKCHPHNKPPPSRSLLLTLQHISQIFMDVTSYREALFANFHQQTLAPFSHSMEHHQIAVPNANEAQRHIRMPITQFADIDAELSPQWVWLLLVTMPISCIVGNTLVVAAVLSNKSLQTPTNYLLLSLACADLMVGTLVAPFHIYMTINSLHWHLPALTCYIYCVLDVLASTSSIIHLLLISMDRLVAATKPADYKTHKHRRRVYMAIAFCWLFSVCLSLPLVFGFNADTERYLLEEHHCGIYNPTYMFGSSIFAFFLPLFFMSLIYGYIFYTLKRRLRAIQLQEMAGGQFLGFGADLGNIATSAMETVIGIDQKNRNMITWEKPLLKKIEETAAEHASSLNESEREQLQNILQATSSSAASRASDCECANVLERRRRGIPPNRAAEASPGNAFIVEEREEISQGHSSSLILDAVTASGPVFGRDSNIANPAVFGVNQKPEQLGMNMLEVPNMNSLSKRRHSDNGQRRRISVISSNLLVDVREMEKRQRRLSLQPPGENEIEQGNLLKAQNRIGSKKSMRRLSELISGWERPSRSSLGQLLAFARRDSVYIARKKLAGLKDWALDLIAKLKSKQGLAIRREARATKLVATVMGVFLVCWAPYFSMNLYKIFKLYNGGWTHDSEFSFHWLSALGYLNSSLNFFIYSAINKKFRITFWRLLGLRRSQRKKRSWMLPPPQHKNRKRRRTDTEQQQQQQKQLQQEHKSPSRSREGDGGTGGRSVSVSTYGVTAQQQQNKHQQQKSIVVRMPKGGQIGGEESRRRRRRKNNAPPEDSGGEPTKKPRKRKKRFVSMIPLSRHLSIRKPQIVIEDLADPIKPSVSISAGGETTYRRSSDDCIQRSCSEVFGGGIVFPSGVHHNSRRGSAMSNSSASLQLHDIHQIEALSAEEIAEVEVKPEVFI
uniref:Protein kinase domain-containing protein n=1 Tax=Globodera rostochiensis TaxID=31243 RepID=A0A914H1F0_GLORO